MKIPNDALLAEMRKVSLCEWCRCYPRHPLEVHHVFTRGAGRLDIAINLIALCGPWDRGCHDRAQRYQIPRGDKPEDAGKDTILARVAKREGTTVEAIVAEIYRLRRE